MFLFSGKHKQNFFEGLLKISNEYLNNLIQDGISSIEIKASTSYIDNNGTAHPRTNSRSSSVHSNLGFSFLYDIPDALKYITMKLVELRTYMQQPAPKVFQDELDYVDGDKQVCCLFVCLS